MNLCSRPRIVLWRPNPCFSAESLAGMNERQIFIALGGYSNAQHHDVMEYGNNSPKPGEATAGKALATDCESRLGSGKGRSRARQGRVNHFANWKPLERVRRDEPRVSDSQFCCESR